MRQAFVCTMSFFSPYYWCIFVSLFSLFQIFVSLQEEIVTHSFSWEMGSKFVHKLTKQENKTMHFLNSSFPLLPN